MTKTKLNFSDAEEEAKTYFEQLSANGTVADDELDWIAGGVLGCPDDGGEENKIARSVSHGWCASRLSFNHNIHKDPSYKEKSK